jgi:hypothetical protein
MCACLVTSERMSGVVRRMRRQAAQCLKTVESSNRVAGLSLKIRADLSQLDHWDPADWRGPTGKVGNEVSEYGQEEE